MVGLILVSGIIGFIIYAFSHIAIAGWVVGIFCFICGLPGALIGGFIHDQVSYAQDRADDRQMLADLAADRRMEEREMFDELDERKPVIKILDKSQQIHIHGGTK